MSTLVAQTISNGTVSTSSANVINGSAKAWVNFNGVSPAIRGSYNVSSITRSGVGNYTVNLTNAMPDTNYCINGSAGSSGSATGCWFTTGFSVAGWVTNNTTTSFRVAIYYTSGNLADVEFIYASINR